MNGTGASDPAMARHTQPEISARHLLVVTYHFPPIQTPGVYRMLGLVKYLRAYGWRISVLTVKRSTYEVSVGNTVELIPEGVEVIRTNTTEAAAQLMRAAGSTAPKPEGAHTPRKKSWLRRALALPGRPLLRALSYPDYQIGWTPRVAREVIAFAKQHPGTVVLSSTPPHSSQLGVRVARAFVRFGWVADFRDPWTAPARKPKGRGNLLAQRAMERWVLFGCDRIVANTEGNRDALLKAFPHLPVERIRVVTNAFDPTLVPPADPNEKPLACDMAYFGELYMGMLDAYLDAMRILVARDPAAAPRLFVYGLVSAADVARVRDYGLESHIVFHGTVSYAKSLALMRAARSLLLLLPGGESLKTCVPSKLYTYLFTGHPVFALVPRGDAARIVEETGAGEVVVPGDAEMTAARLQSFIGRVRRGELSGSSTRDEHTARYSMDRVARDLNGVLEEVRARG